MLLRQQLLQQVTIPSIGENPVTEVDALAPIIYGGGGTKNYDELINKPKINNVKLQGNLTLEDIGVEEHIQFTSSEISDMWNSV